MCVLKAHCAVCISYVPLTDVRILQCGHGFCEICITAIKNDRDRPPVCPTCRRSILDGKRVKNRLSDGQPLYITILDFDSDEHSDALVSKTERVKKELEQMSVDSRVETVEKAGKDIERLSKGMVTSDKCAKILVDAVKSLKDRVIPLFTAVQSLQRKYDTANAEIQQLRADLQTSIAKTDKTQSDLERALKLGEDAKKEIVRLRDENTRLQERASEAVVQAETAKEAAAEMTKEVRSLKGMLIQHKNDALLERSRNKGLCKELKGLKSINKTLRSSPREEDDPLYVLAPDEELEHHSSSSSPASHKSHTRSHFQAQRPTADADYPRPPAPVSIELEFEGLPRPGFTSDWTLQSSQSANSKKRKLGGNNTGNALRPTFGLQLDGNGKTKGTVQLGRRRKW